jgi:hypothetical protein
MSHDPRHRSRRRRRIQVEPLERRALLSAGYVYSPEKVLLTTPSSVYVNQQEGAFTVTLTLTKLRGNGGYMAASLDQPLTVEFSASLTSTIGDSTPSASPIFAPFGGSVTFPAGASTETVTVPIISSVATPGPVQIYFTATTTSSSVSLVNAQTWVELYSSPDAVPPTITSVQLVTHGKLASAVVLDFSKPMTPATAENIHNYRITSRENTTYHGSFLFGVFGGGVFGSETTEYRSFPIGAAAYDPTARAVTLTLKRPVKASSLYEVSSATPIKRHVLTDLQGQPLSQGFPDGAGTFTVAVHPALGVTPQAVVGPHKSSIQFNNLTL